MAVSGLFTSWAMLPLISPRAAILAEWIDAARFSRSSRSARALARCSRTKAAMPPAIPTTAQAPSEECARAASDAHTRAATAKTEQAWEKPGAIVM